MLEKIMSLVRGQVADSVDGISGIPEDKKEATVNTTAQSLVDGLKKYATPDKISQLSSMLGGGSPSASSGEVAGTLQTSVVSALGKKVGLDPAVAQKIASTVIPAVMSLLKKKVGDDKDPGFNLQTLVGSLTGKGGGSAGGGVMDMVGSFLGKK